MAVVVPHRGRPRLRRAPRSASTRRASTSRRLRAPCRIGRRPRAPAGARPPFRALRGAGRAGGARIRPLDRAHAHARQGRRAPAQETRRARAVRERASSWATSIRSRRFTQARSIRNHCGHPTASDGSPREMAILVQIEEVLRAHPVHADSVRAGTAHAWN